MLQQVSINQTSRKKILTRSDLISELENILEDLKARTQFASLRSYSLEAFYPSDNPYLKQITLGSLATNPAEVLRDTTLVDRKEIAGLVEALHLVSVRSDHSLSLIRDTFTKIERSADSIQRALQEIASTLPQNASTRRAPPEDANVAKLRTALSDLRKSKSFDQVKSMLIESFWEPTASSCTHLSKMTWLEVIETPASALFDLPNFGKSRFNHLIASIKQAQKYGCENLEEKVIDSDLANKNTIDIAQKSITAAINEIKANRVNGTEDLSEVLSRSNSHALLTAFLSQSTIQRRVGQLLGVTESRISQLLQESARNIVTNFSTYAPTLLHKLETKLSSPLCSEDVLLPFLGLNHASKDTVNLIRTVLTSIGAHNPCYKGKALKTHWSKSQTKIEGALQTVIEKLPSKTIDFSNSILSLFPDCSTNELLGALSTNIYFLRTRDSWYETQEKALYDILKSSERPLTSQEITEIFETGPRQMRYLLQNSKNIIRIGRNNGRKYTIAT